MRELEERERREGKKMADEEALRKIRSVEEQIDMLNKKLSIAKQVCGLFFFLFVFLKPTFPILPHTVSPPRSVSRRKTPY